MPRARVSSETRRRDELIAIEEYIAAHGVTPMPNAPRGPDIQAIEPPRFGIPALQRERFRAVVGGGLDRIDYVLNRLT